MTVIAGASLFSGVLLTADSRCTYKYNGKQIAVDHLQKLFQLTPNVCLGFSGDVRAAGDLLRHVIKQLSLETQSNRTHASSVLRWLPRIFSYHYNRDSSRKQYQGITFIVAATVSGRPNVIERKRAVALMERFRTGQLSHIRNWLPGILLKVLSTPAKEIYVPIKDTPTGILCVMKSPNFHPEYFSPLSAIAIGSGEGAITQIDEEADWVFAGDVGNPFVETQALVGAVKTYVFENKIDYIGGLFCSMKLTGTECKLITTASEVPIGGTRIRLTLNDNGRLVQQNLTTGKSIQLLYPWELSLYPIPKENKFDDLDEAYSKMLGKNIKRH